MAGRREVYLPLVASAALAVAMFAIRRVVRVRAVTIARVFVPALLVAPLLIEPVLYDDDRVGMALAGAFFAAALSVLATRAPAGPPATEHCLATFALVTSLPAGLGWVAAFHRERVVELTARVRSLDSTIGRLARANREFQAYAGTVKSESAAEERSRITRELHDTVGYALTNVIVMMDAAKARAREDPESLDSLLDDVRAQSELALNDTRQILHLLRSVEQFKRKATDAIFQLTRAFEEAMGLSVELHVGNLPPTLGPRIDSVLFRLRIHRRKLDQGGRRVPPGQHDPRGLRAVQLILNTGGFDSVDLFATDKAGLTNFQSVPVHYNGFVERWKQFNPDRSFFDHVKVLRPFPVDGYDFHAIGRAGETGFWFGAEIVPLKTDADGNMQVASDLYPIMSGAAGFSYLANWPEDAVQYVNPKIPAAVREASIAEIEWFHSVGGKDTPAIPAVQAIDVPEKQNLTIDVGASWARFIIDDSGKSNEELYQEMIAEWNANGYADAVNAITAAAKEMGL